MLFGLSFEVYFICMIIAVTTFFLSKWLLKNLITSNRTRKFTGLTIAIIATPVIYLGLIRLLMFWITHTPSQSFDKTKWLTEKEDRFLMADDIIDSKMLINKDTNQVKQILGDPTWRSDTIKTWSYDMGFGGGGLGFLFHNLNVKLDNEGKVISIRHVEIRD